MAISGTADFGTALGALEFVYSVEGDYWVRRVWLGEVRTYDASELVLETTGRGLALRRDGIPPAGPDPDTTDFEWGRYLVGMTLERAAAGTAAQSEALGRPALSWKVSFETDEGPAETLDVVMDQETWIPLRLQHQWAPDALNPEGRVETWTVSKLEVGLVPRSLFRQGLERGDAAGSDQGFKPVNVEEVGGIASYAPPLPAWVPEGFKLASVSYADVLPWGAWAEYPDQPAREVFVAVYRSGFAYFAVTSRRVAGGVRLDDPNCLMVCPQGRTFGTSAGADFQVRAAGPGLITNASGACTNAWGEFDGIRITVDGDLTVSDLKAILDSLPLKADSSG